MAEIKQWYVRTNDGKYLVNVVTTTSLISFDTKEEAEAARQETGRIESCYVTDVPPAALQKPGIVI